MNISPRCQAMTPCADYRSLYAPAASGAASFERSLTQTQSSSLSFTTAEGDVVNFSAESLSSLHSRQTNWLSPLASGMGFTEISLASESAGISVEGDLNEQELADVTRLVRELGTIASSFFSGDLEAVMSGVAGLGDMGSITSLEASFSRQTISQTRLASTVSLPSMADLQGVNAEDLYRNGGAARIDSIDYQGLLEARWQQIVKALDRFEEGKTALGLARGVTREGRSGPAVPDLSPLADRAAGRMLDRMTKTLAEHPKLTPLAPSLAAAAMERAAGETGPNNLEGAEKAFGILQDSFRSQWRQWFLGDASKERFISSVAI